MSNDNERNAPDIIANVEGGRLNYDLFFPPVAGNLAGTVRASNVHAKQVEGAQIGEIPGYQIQIWMGENPRAAIVDRLKTKEFSHLLQKMEDQLKKDESSPYSSISKDFKRHNCVQPMEQELTIQPPHNLATWLFWLSNARLMHQVTVVKGADIIPSREVIRSLGDVYLCDPYAIQTTGEKQHHLLPKEDLPSEPKRATAKTS